VPLYEGVSGPCVDNAITNPIAVAHTICVTKPSRAWRPSPAGKPRRASPRHDTKPWRGPELERITCELRAFRDASQAELPRAAVEALDRFFVQDWFTKQPELINTNLVSIAAIATVRSEVEYLIHDSEIEGRNRSEVAFGHLQRMIAVDSDVREKWKGAYAQNEPACERLGAVHLLSHGIFAFKISSIDSATDLAFNEPLDDRSQIIRQSARAIVLTEWKLVKDTNETIKKATEARKQTLEYARGVLGDAELKGARYIVLVSKRQLAPPGDVEADGVRFRHINIVVEPLTPSRVARVSAN
jgi:hypothetical protein